MIFFRDKVLALVLPLDPETPVPGWYGTLIGFPPLDPEMEPVIDVGTITGACVVDTPGTGAGVLTGSGLGDGMFPLQSGTRQHASPGSVRIVQDAGAL